MMAPCRLRRPFSFESDLLLPRSPIGRHGQQLRQQAQPRGCVAHCSAGGTVPPTDTPIRHQHQELPTMAPGRQHTIACVRRRGMPPRLPRKPLVHAAVVTTQERIMELPAAASMSAWAQAAKPTNATAPPSPFPGAGAALPGVARFSTGSPPAVVVQHEPQQHVTTTLLQGQLCQSVQLWLCFRLAPDGQSAELYETTMDVGPMTDDIWDLIRSGPSPVAVLPLGGATFEECGHKDGPWRCYCVRVTGAFGPEEADVMYPNRIELVGSGRAMFNIGNLQYLVSFLADPTQAQMEGHLAALAASTSSFSLCYRRLRAKWGLAAMRRLGFSKVQVARKLLAMQRAQQLEVDWLAHEQRQRCLGQLQKMR